jgi:signal transduction histidine kinase
MRLWIKIALLNSLVVTLLSILIGFGIRDTVTSAMRSELTNHGISLAQHLSDRVADSILLQDIYRITEAISDIRRNEKDIEYVYVIDDTGRMLSHTFSSGYPSGILQWNALERDSSRIQLLDTEKGFIRDIGIRVFEGMNAEVHVGMREDRISQTIARLRNIIIALTGFVIGCGSIVSFVMSRITTRHLDALVQFTAGLARGDFDQKIQINSSDEVGELARRFETLSAELKSHREKLQESYKQMLRTEKLTALGRLSAGLAHELRNPLTSIKVLFQTFRDDPKLTKRDMEVVLAAAEQMDDLLTKFLRFAKSDEFNPTEVYLNAVLKQVAKLVQFQLDKQSIALDFQLSKLPPIKADRSLLQQALMNLILNAIEAMPEGGKLSITSQQEDGYYRIGIGDTGRGISEALRDKVFDPFFTTKEDGTGLGLSIVYNIVTLHHGQITVESNERGTIFWLRIPSQPFTPFLS